MNSPDPVSTAQPVLPHEPWYASEVQVRLVIAGLMQLVSIVFRTLDLFGVHVISQANLDQLLANATQGAALLFGMLAAIKRQQSPISPLTFTAKGAEDKTRANPPIIEQMPVKPT